MEREVASDLSMSVIEAFFKIHFSCNEEILEDLLPKLSKIDPNQPLPNSIKTVLEDSGPCVNLLNKVLKDPRTHYKPSNILIVSRYMELEELYETLFQIRKVLPSELEFNTVVAALIAFHKKQTEYIQVFDFLLTVINDNALVRRVIKFLPSKALHYAVQYVPEDSSDDDEFSFDEMSDVDADLHTRMRIKETIPDILNKVDISSNENASYALFLYMTDAIPRPDLLMVVPELENSRLKADPAAIEAHNFVKQSIKKGETKPDPQQMPLKPFSYRVVPKAILQSEFIGASPTEQFALNRAYVSTVSASQDYKPAFNIDQTVSLPYISGAGEILTDQEIDIETLYQAITDLQMNRVPSTLNNPLYNIYGILCDEISDYLKSLFNSAKDVVIETMKAALEKMIINYYRSFNGCFVRESQAAVRTFPYQNYIEESMKYLRDNIIPEKQDLLKIIDENLVEKVNQVRSTSGPHSYPIAPINLILLTRFCKFYKVYLRKFHPTEFLMPISPLIDSSFDWKIEFEFEIIKLLKELDIYQYDDEECQYKTPILDTLLKECVDDIVKDFPVPEEIVESSPKQVKYEIVNNNKLILTIR